MKKSFVKAVIAPLMAMVTNLAAAQVPEGKICVEDLDVTYLCKDDLCNAQVMDVGGQFVLMTRSGEAEYLRKEIASFKQAFINGSDLSEFESLFTFNNTETISFAGPSIYLTQDKFLSIANCKSPAM